MSDIRLVTTAGYLADDGLGSVSEAVTAGYLPDPPTYPASGSIVSVQDSGGAGTVWTMLDWTSTEPTGTSVKARVRAAETQVGLASATWSAWVQPGATAWEAALAGADDFNGIYANTGDTNDGQPVYLHLDGVIYLWYSAANDCWNLSGAVGDTSPNYISSTGTLPSTWVPGDGVAPPGPVLTDVISDGSINVTGRWLETEVALETSDPLATPTLFDLTVTGYSDEWDSEQVDVEGLGIGTADRLVGSLSEVGEVVDLIPCTAAGRALLDDVNAAAQRGTLGLDTDDTVQFAKLGINTTPTGASVFQVVCDGVTTDIPIFGKVDQVSDNIFTGLRLLSIRDGNMGDGFGSSLVLAIQDDVGVLNVIGQVAAVRDGADDTGKLVFRTATGGTFDSRLEVSGTTTSVIGNLSVDAGATMYADATANRVGFGGETSPEGAIHTNPPSAAELPMFERVGDSNSVFGCGRVVCTKATDMGDGFGPAWYFYIRDDAGVLNLIGGIGACRAGADNTGHVTIYTVTAGATRAERMRVMNTGTVGIGTTTDGLTAGGSLNVAKDIKAGVRFGLGLTPIARRTHVADPAGGTTIDAEARTAINAILATLEAYGFHATS